MILITIIRDRKIFSELLNLKPQATLGEDVNEEEIYWNGPLSKPTGQAWSSHLSLVPTPLSIPPSPLPPPPHPDLSVLSRPWKHLKRSADTQLKLSRALGRKLQSRLSNKIKKLGRPRTDGGEERGGCSGEGRRGW